MNIVVYPPAKINLGLNVIEKRSDGFHNIETLFVPTTLKDIIEIVESDSFSIVRYGTSYPLADNDDRNDICYKAYKLLQSEYNLPPVTIYLYKNIPSGGGLGGGSSDAASVLKALNKLFNLNISTEELEHYALQLGSDCPFFIHKTPMLAKGRGELLSTFTNPNIEELVKDDGKYYIRLFTNDFHISTAQAYSRVIPHKKDLLLTEALSKDITEWKNYVINDFEASVFSQLPQLKEIKEDIYAQGAIYASMSGSGSTMYGIFCTSPEI